MSATNGDNTKHISWHISFQKNSMMMNQDTQILTFHFTGVGVYVKMDSWHNDECLQCMIRMKVTVSSLSQGLFPCFLMIKHLSCSVHHKTSHPLQHPAPQVLATHAQLAMVLQKGSLTEGMALIKAGNFHPLVYDCLHIWSWILYTHLSSDIQKS